MGSGLTPEGEICHKIGAAISDLKSWESKEDKGRTIIMGLSGMQEQVHANTPAGINILAVPHTQDQILLILFSRDAPMSRREKMDGFCESAQGQFLYTVEDYNNPHREKR